jgi:hypothetical protein
MSFYTEIQCAYGLFIKVAQQSVHLTLGIPPHFQAFFWLRVISAPKPNPPPAQPQVTQTVSLLVVTQIPANSGAT